MKIHQPILIGSSQTSASLNSEGVITSSAVLIGSLRVTTASLDYYNTSSAEWQPIIQSRGGDSFITASQVANFAEEVVQAASASGVFPTTSSLFPYSGSAKIDGKIILNQSADFINDDLLLIRSAADKGEVAVNDEGILNLKWSGSLPPTVLEGAFYYSASAFYMGIGV